MQFVIASEAKQSMARRRIDGLLRYARNDGERESVCGGQSEACPPLKPSREMVGTAQTRLCPPHGLPPIYAARFADTMPHSAIAAIASEISTL